MNSVPHPLKRTEANKNLLNEVTWTKSSENSKPIFKRIVVISLNHTSSMTNTHNITSLHSPLEVRVRDWGFVCACVSLLQMTQVVNERMFLFLDLPSVDWRSSRWSLTAKYLLRVLLIRETLLGRGHYSSFPFMCGYGQKDGQTLYACFHCQYHCLFSVSFLYLRICIWWILSE